MGRSGGRKGYKVFSINTTIRNPDRNVGFLECFKEFDGKKFSKELQEKYFLTLVQQGIYHNLNVKQSVKEKLNNKKILTAAEAQESINNNPQATGIPGRVITQLRALKDQGFLIFDGGKTPYLISITALGKELLDGKEHVTDIYSKAMLGLEANSPARLKVFNKSRPFLNTIFVIKTVNEKCVKLGKKPNGIFKHEFGIFVLSMKDCDYKRAADRIMNYRSVYGNKINEEYIKKYLFEEQGLIPLNIDSVIKEYPDDVMRKFQMTGLLMTHGAYQNIFYNFSNYNMKKVESLIRDYKDYKYIQYSTKQDYYNAMANIILPWQAEDSVRIGIIEHKAETLGKKITNFENLTKIEDELDKDFYANSLNKAISKSNLDITLKELNYLSSTKKYKSKYSSVSEPLRLEYLIALALGKKFKTRGLQSNIIYNEEGYPISFAGAGKSDVIYRYEEAAITFEPTMIKNRNQQLNSETTNVCRHMQNVIKEYQKEVKTMMIAPYVHPDVANYFKYRAFEDKLKIAPISINEFVELVKKSDSIQAFGKNFDSDVLLLLENNTNKYCQIMNGK